jgi:HIUase/Transthyretin family
MSIHNSKPVRHTRLFLKRKNILNAPIDCLSILGLRYAATSLLHAYMSEDTPQITFVIEKPEDHYHIPLLISPYSFTTYRGS